MRRILHALSFDYDGCLLPGPSDAAITYPSIIESNKRLLKAIRKQNGDFNSTTGYIGSSRQSHDTDKTNRRERDATTVADPTSCFIPVRRLIEEEMKARFSPFLLADTYESKPDGTAYHQAITADETAHHVSWVFDDSKSSIIYLQAHLAAQEARDCDFISLKEEPNWETLPTRSHAAYVYLENTRKLYYVNKIDHTHSELSIPDNSSWSAFLEAATEQLSAETQSFQRSMIDPSEQTIEGIILSDAQLKTINSITQHQHKKEDHPIVFDFYDDRTDILLSLRDLFSKNPSFLPKNMTVRLHHHSILEADKVNAPTTLITGTGPIDLNPHETICQIAKTVQEKAGVDSSSFDYHTQYNFKKVMMSKDCQKIFKARQVVKPTVSIKEKESKHAIVSDYDSNLNPDDYRAVKALLNTLQAEFDRNWIGFFHYERKLPKKTMLETLLRRTQTEEVSTVLSELKQSYPNDHAVFKGWRSHRTKDLFDKLERDYLMPPSPAPQ